MPRRRADEEEEHSDDLAYEDDDRLAEDEEEDEDEEYDHPAEKKQGKRPRSRFIDDAAEEDDDDEEGEYGGGRSRRKKKQKKSKNNPEAFFEIEAEDDSDEEESEEDEVEDGFFVNGGADEIPDEDSGRPEEHRRPILHQEDDNEDLDEIERRLEERYSRLYSRVEYDEETTEVEQQARLPSVRDPKLWNVKCKTGRERETAACLLQKCIDLGGSLQIRSVIALDNLKNYIYVEADKEAHVREACKGMANITYPLRPVLVRIEEMTDVLSVERKVIDLPLDAWVRIKTGAYKGDLGKVVDVDNVSRRVKVKLIPRIDLRAIASKQEGREVVKKKSLVRPPPRFMNLEEARELNVHVERRKDKMTDEIYFSIDRMMFKDGFLYKTLSMKSISATNIKPSFDEVEKFSTPGDNGVVDAAGLSALLANRKKGHFLKGDAVTVIKGDLKSVKGVVEKVEEDNVHIRPLRKDLPETLIVHEKELCKYFEPGNHVKVVSGTQEGATGMVVKSEKHVLDILSDTTKEQIRVFAADVVKSSEVATGATKIGDYELHDLVVLDNTSFGVIIRVEREAFRVLKGFPDRSEVSLVRLREIKCKVEKRSNVQDKYGSAISVKDVVKVIDGPCKGKQGPVEHIYKGVLFIHDRHHLEHAGFICVKAEACNLVGGSRSKGDRNDNVYPRFGRPSNTHRILPSPPTFQRGPSFESGGRGKGRHDSLVGTTITVRKGLYKGYRGRVKEIKGQSVVVELDSQGRPITVDRNDVMVPTPRCDTNRHGMGSETPMHPSRTPLHPCMTPMRDARATPTPRGMVWDPYYAPTSPPRDNWEEGNPASWGTNSKYQPGSTPSRDSYANAPSLYLPSTPAMTPSSASYNPRTPSGGGLDAMSPALGDNNDRASVMADIVVNVHRRGEEPELGVVREVHPDGACKVRLNESGETVSTMVSEVEIVAPRRSDKVKITGGVRQGLTGKLTGVDGTDGIVKLDDTLEMAILDMVVLAKLGH